MSKNDATDSFRHAGPWKPNRDSHWHEPPYPEPLGKHMARSPHSSCPYVHPSAQGRYAMDYMHVCMRIVSVVMWRGHLCETHQIKGIDLYLQLEYPYCYSRCTAQRFLRLMHASSRNAGVGFRWRTILFVSELQLSSVRLINASRLAQHNDTWSMHSGYWGLRMCVWPSLGWSWERIPNPNKKKYSENARPAEAKIRISELLNFRSRLCSDKRGDFVV